jgi:uncharacterized membrane protein
MIVKKEIKSTVNNKNIYASAGDEIEILKWMGDVAICNGKNGKFPATKVELLGEPEVEGKKGQLSMF